MKTPEYWLSNGADIVETIGIGSNMVKQSCHKVIADTETIKKIQQDAFLAGKAEGLVEGREKGLKEAAEIIRSSTYLTYQPEYILSAINKKESPE